MATLRDTEEAIVKKIKRVATVRVRAYRRGFIDGFTVYTIILLVLGFGYAGTLKLLQMQQQTTSFKLKGTNASH